MAQGARALTEHELLALVLRNGTAGASALDLAMRLLADYGGLRALTEARPEELAVRSGIGAAKAAALVAAFELGRRDGGEAPTAPLRSPRQVAEVARRELAGARRERVLVLVCDASNRLRHTVVVSEGAIDRSLVPVREVLNAVLRHDGRAFAVAHNHPAGEPGPSPADVSATDALREAANAVGLRFLGHVVVAADRFEVVSESRPLGGNS